MTLEEAITWMRKLDDELWKKEEQMESRGTGYRKVLRRKLLRKMTEGEIDTLASTSELPVGWEMNPGSICEIYLRAYELPSYPGASPTPVLVISENHLPFDDKDKNRNGSGLVWPAAWDFFSKFSHTEQNLARAKMFGLDRPRERSHYDY